MTGSTHMAMANVISKKGKFQNQINHLAMTARIILEGITLEDLLSGVKEIVREEIRQADADKLRPITKKECYTKLGITNKTLDKILKSPV